MIQGDKHQVSRGGLGLARLLVMGLGVGEGKTLWSCQAAGYAAT